MDVSAKLQKEQTLKNFGDDVNNARDNNYDGLGIIIADAAAKSLQQQTAVNAAEAVGGADPLAAARLKNRDPNQLGTGWSCSN